MLLTHRYQISTRELTYRYTAVVRAELPAAELPAWVAAVLPTVTAYVRRARVRRTGPPFARYAAIGDLIAVEAGFPVAEEIEGDGLVEPSTLPDGDAAVTTHSGPYEGLPRAYRAVLDWVAAAGRAPAGPHWEVFHTGPAIEPDPARWRTELVVPYERR
jgi:effector-binding domain-containing protein